MTRPFSPSLDEWKVIEVTEGRKVWYRVKSGWLVDTRHYHFLRSARQARDKYNRQDQERRERKERTIE